MILFVGLLCACSTSGGTDSRPPYDPDVVVRQVGPKLWSIQLTRIEQASPHGFSPWPFAGKVRVKRWLYVDRRTGYTDVADILYGSLPEMRSRFSASTYKYKGGITADDQTVTVAIFWSPDGRSWSPAEENGTYHVTAAPAAPTR